MNPKEVEQLAELLNKLATGGREAARALKAEVATWPDGGEAWIGEAASWLDDIAEGNDI